MSRQHSLRWLIPSASSGLRRSMKIPQVHRFCTNTYSSHFLQGHLKYFCKHGFVVVVLVILLCPINEATVVCAFNQEGQNFSTIYKVFQTCVSCRSLTQPRYTKCKHSTQAQMCGRSTVDALMFRTVVAILPSDALDREAYLSRQR
jgi:hypothetical protein